MEITAVRNDTFIEWCSVGNPEYICCPWKDHIISCFRPFCEKSVKIWHKKIHKEIAVTDSRPYSCLPLVLISSRVSISWQNQNHIQQQPTAFSIDRKYKALQVAAKHLRLQESADSSFWEICWNLTTLGVHSKKIIDLCTEAHWGLSLKN